MNLVLVCWDSVIHQRLELLPYICQINILAYPSTNDGKRSILGAYCSELVGLVVLISD